MGEYPQHEQPSRGWRLRVLSYNTFLHPEILTSKLASESIPRPLRALQSEVNPEQINLLEVLAAMLVRKNVLHKNKEAWLGAASTQL